MSYKSNLKAHLIFVTKYRKPILCNSVDVQLKTIFQEIQFNSDFQIGIMETDIDHIHMIISYPPTLAILSIVRKLKQVSTLQMWKHYSDFLSKIYYREHTFWSDGYFVTSIGDASTSTVKEYIRTQGK